MTEVQEGVWLNRVGEAPIYLNLGATPQVSNEVPPKLIGLAAKARSGKDTAANMVLTFAPWTATLSFAQPIRDAMTAIFGFGYEHFHGALKEVVIPEYGKSPRQMMQYLGTEWGRNCVHTDLWLTLAGKKIAQAKAEGKNVIVTDVRFENEAEFIRGLGGTIWHIERGEKQAVNAHASEAGVAVRKDLGDIVIDNNGTLDDLFENVSAAWEGIQ